MTGRLPTFNAVRVARVLSESLWRKLTAVPGDGDAFDDSIEVTQRVFIQVGETYLIVNAWANGDTVRHRPNRSGYADIMADIREAMVKYPEDGQ